MADHEDEKDVPEPFLVEQGWDWCDIVRQALNEDFRLLYYPNGDVRFEHRCRSEQYGTRVIAPLIHLGPVDPGWTVTRNDRQTHANPRGEPTIKPSIDCPDCDLHGFIVDGWWRG